MKENLEQQTEFEFMKEDRAEYFSVNNRLERVGTSFGEFKVVSHPGRLVIGNLYRSANRDLIIYEGVFDRKYSFIQQGFDFEKIKSERAEGIYFITSINVVLLDGPGGFKDYQPGSEEHSNAKRLLVNVGQWKEKPKERRKRIKQIKEEQR